MKKILLTLFVMLASCSVWSQNPQVPSVDRYTHALIPYLHPTCKISAYKFFNIGNTPMYHINGKVEELLRYKGYILVTEDPSSEVLSFEVTSFPYNRELIETPFLTTISCDGCTTHIYRDLKFKNILQGI